MTLKQCFRWKTLCNVTIFTQSGLPPLADTWIALRYGDMRCFDFFFSLFTLLLYWYLVGIPLVLMFASTSTSSTWVPTASNLKIFWMIWSFLKISGKCKTAADGSCVGLVLVWEEKDRVHWAWDPSMPVLEWGFH